MDYSLSNYVTKIYKLLYPSLCCLCYSNTASARFCTHCIQLLQPVAPRIISRSSSRAMTLHSVYRYGPILHRLLYAKYVGNSALLEVQAELLFEYCQRYSLTADVVTIVPQHWTRTVYRGGNHVHHLARLFNPVELLIKSRVTSYQVGKSGAQRRRNIRKSIAVKDQTLVCGKTILLIDDVYTSGATLSECAKVLYAAGAESVIGLTVCRVSYL